MPRYLKTLLASVDAQMTAKMLSLHNNTTPFLFLWLGWWPASNLLYLALEICNLSIPFV